MGWTGRALCVLGLALATSAQAALSFADFGPHKPSDDARYVADWALGAGDADGKPFVIVDKKDARIYVFGAQGRLIGSSAALLGQAPGDHTVAGVGQRTQAGTVQPEDRTTPAGRFISQPGRNLQGEKVVWVDYAAAFAIHRLRPGTAKERREARLASPTPEDNRASLGCVVVPVAFYEQVVQPMLGNVRAVVYVLPETQPVHEMFGNM
jgi:hypothetical protein